NFRNFGGSGAGGLDCGGRGTHNRGCRGSGQFRSLPGMAAASNDCPGTPGPAPARSSLVSSTSVTRRYEMSSTLSIRDLHVSVGDVEILKGVNLDLRQGETHALMGPNGSGKSTLAYTLIGHPKYEVTRGTISIDGQDINELDPSERARLGLFLAFQY